MTGQYGLTKKQQKIILRLLETLGISTEPIEQTLNEKTGKYQPFHREITIHVCSYDDENKKFEMYVEVD